MSKSFELLQKRLLTEAKSHGRIANIARETGVSRVTLDRWIAGESIPSLENLDRVAAALGENPWDLLKPVNNPVATPAAVLSALAVASLIYSAVSDPVRQAKPFDPDEYLKTH